MRAANRYGWDYRRAAAALGPPVVPIIDAHSHLAGVEPCKVFDEVKLSPRQACGWWWHKGLYVGTPRPEMDRLFPNMALVRAAHGLQHQHQPAKIMIGVAAAR